MGILENVVTEHERDEARIARLKTAFLRDPEGAIESAVQEIYNIIMVRSRREEEGQSSSEIREIRYTAMIEVACIADDVLKMLRSKGGLIP